MRLSFLLLVLAFASVLTGCPFFTRGEREAEAAEPAAEAAPAAPEAGE